MEKPLVSVIIPTYKRPDVLSRSINSILKQSYENYEIIVVDDNSADSEERKKTEIVMDQYLGNSRITYLKHPYNKNGSAARNTGFEASKGQYIMFLDDDDEFFKDKMLMQVQCLKGKDETWGACYTGYIRVNSNGTIVAKGAEVREGELLIEELKRNLFVHAGSNLMVRRCVMEELNGFDETFQRNQDVEFLVRLLKKYKLAYVDVVGLIVHVHESVSKVNFIDLTEQYISKFYNDIESFGADEKKNIYEMYSLQRFRYYLLSEKNFVAAFREIHDNKINCAKVIRYLVYLVHRAISKKAYGFKG
jgi:glycosyltransferase involved in cell wall biosynthesis